MGTEERSPWTHDLKSELWLPRAAGERHLWGWAGAPGFSSGVQGPDLGSPQLWIPPRTPARR